MLIHNKKLSVTPITTHIDIKMYQKYKQKSIINKSKQLINGLKQFKIKPKIGILGLNPHNCRIEKEF